MGHFIDLQHGGELSALTEDSLQDTSPRTWDRLESLLGKISEYAKASSAEAAAELTALHFLGKPSPPEFARVGEFLDKVAPRHMAGGAPRRISTAPVKRAKSFEEWKAKKPSDVIIGKRQAPLAEDWFGKFNPNHEPAGSPEGGQFASGAGGGGSAATVREHLNKMYEKAPAAKTEVDSIAMTIANKIPGAKVITAPPKGMARAIEKALNDYEGDASRIKDLVRNTVVVPTDKYAEAVALLKQVQGMTVKEISPENDPLGYSGANGFLSLQAGIKGEIQVNTPQMIFGKLNSERAKALLGEASVNEIAEKTHLPAGEGHALYERWRVLDKSDASNPHVSALTKASRDYYSALRLAA
jgi:hypothetical protein